MTDATRVHNPTSQAVILLADEVCQSREGKWIICGTYNARWTRKPKMTFANDQIAVYGRFVLDRGGIHSFRVKIIDSSARPGREVPIREIVGQLNIQDPKNPIEIGLRIPLDPLPCPVKKSNLKIGQPAAVNLLIQLEVDEFPVASSLLRLIFSHPKDPHGHQAAPFAQSYPIEPTEGDG